jgi:hypothetical protein
MALEGTCHSPTGDAQLGILTSQVRPPACEPIVDDGKRITNKRPTMSKSKANARSAKTSSNDTSSEARNKSSAKPAKATTKVEKRAAKAAKKPSKLPTNENGVVMLSGGNPQIPKWDGDAPVQAYITNMPGWKKAIGKRLDEIIASNVPDVRKAVKWNSPFYGIEGQGWFLTFHVFTRYVKVTFFAGASLKPIPPGSGKDQKARWIDIYEDDGLDEAQMASWVKQAAAIPGWIP